jgi:hypothetical protein
VKVGKASLEMKHGALNMMPKAKFAMRTANSIPITQEITMKTSLTLRVLFSLNSFHKTKQSSKHHDKALYVKQFVPRN